MIRHASRNAAQPLCSHGSYSQRYRLLLYLHVVSTCLMQPADTSGGVSSRKATTVSEVQIDDVVLTQQTRRSVRVPLAKVLVFVVVGWVGFPLPRWREKNSSKRWRIRVWIKIHLLPDSSFNLEIQLQGTCFGIRCKTSLTNCIIKQRKTKWITSMVNN